MPDGRLTGALAALLLGLAGCGGGGDADAGGSDRARTPAAAVRDARRRHDPGRRSTRTPCASVRAWADTLRSGDVRGAARYFAIPSLVSNGTSPIKLESRVAARFFNRSLPCGAELIDTEPAPHGFLIATFRLTERPGPGQCGTGTGETARTAFRVRDAHITDWLRVQDVESAPETLS